LKNFSELRPEFPGLGSEDKHYPERKPKNKNENTYGTNAARHIADSYETKA
jgi:hypothetical protein